MNRLSLPIVASVLAAISSLPPQAARAQYIVVGANVVNPLRASVADQNAVFAQLHAAGVHVIRCGISADAKGIDFAKRAAAQDIKIELGVGLKYATGAPTRPYQPEVYPAMWGGPPLSYADPALSKTMYQFLFDQFDANNIILAGLELGNEINWAAFNPEFPLPGEGKILSLDDLAHDPEGKQIAKGFLQYLKILAALKEVRDHSRLNRDTPIILAGLVAAPDGEKLYNNKKEDMVSLPSTIAFMRAHGLDSLVDAYGIHSYPWADHPGDPAAAARRAARLESVDLAECRAPGASDGKPCWITEWGFPNNNVSCPADDSARALLVQEMRVHFAQAAAQKRLQGIIYFAWDSDPWSKKVDPDSVYRCGELSEAGRLAVAPLDASKTLDDAKSAAPDANIRVRVGVPLVARGPAGDIADNWFSEIQLPNGKFRGFTAAGVTWAVDGAHAYDMGGTGVKVLKPGPGGSASSCGQWIQHSELDGNTLLGWVHEETACNYSKGGQTHASMSLATSKDYGLTWKFEGPIITGTDPPAAGKSTGDSCPTVVRGKDGYFYAYCLHNGGQSWNGGFGFVARAPVSKTGPGNWKKYFNGAWSEPGVGGKSSKAGGADAYWLTTDEMVGVTNVSQGLGLSVSKDYLNFTNLLSQPMMLLEYGDWGRKNGLELYAYEDLIDAKTGLNQLSDHWLLAYMYLKPGEGFDKRYLVFQPVDISWGRKPGEPEAGVMLTHWYSARLHEHRATVSPVPGNYSQYRLVGELGYLMTAPDPKQKSVELEECVSKSKEHPDYILFEKGECETQGYQRLRNVGYAYSSQQPDTQPLYRCYSDADKSHFAANDEDCDHMGNKKALLGYALKQ